MQTSARFSKPIDAARPRGAHRLEAFSPKLDRRLSLFSRASFELWLGLEADPAVQTLCERPGFIQCDQKRRLAEFWVRYAEREELLLLEASEAADADMTGSGSAAPLVDAQLAVRIIQPAERAAARIWISNWERMLPCVIANRKLLSQVDA